MIENWYSVQGLFRWYFKSSNETHLYEDRVVLIKARSFDEALDKAKVEAEEYCLEDNDANFMIESLERFSAHEIIDSIQDGTELLSSRVESSLKSNEYIERYCNHKDS